MRNESADSTLLEDSSQELYKEGVELSKGSYYMQALYKFSDSIEQQPTPETFLQRGFVYRMREDYELAKSDFTASIMLKFKNPEAFLQRGYIHIVTENYPLAIKNLRYSIWQRPHNPEAYLQLGYAFLKTEDYKRAVENINISLKQNPQNQYATDLLALAESCHANSLRATQAENNLNPVAKDLQNAAMQASSSMDKPLPVESMGLASSSLSSQPQETPRLVSLPEVACPSFEARTHGARSSEASVNPSFSL